FRFVLNPAPARPLPDALLAHCDVLTPNRTEALALAPDIKSLLCAGARAVAVTCGKEGADLHRMNRPGHHQPAFAVEVRDPTGAGDAFSAALAWALATGSDLEQAIRIGAAAGALATRAIGARASLPDATELRDLLQS